MADTTQDHLAGADAKAGVAFTPADGVDVVQPQQTKTVDSFMEAVGRYIQVALHSLAIINDHPHNCGVVKAQQADEWAKLRAAAERLAAGVGGKSE